MKFKTKTRLFSLILSMAMAFCLFPAASASAATTINYVALGDSIATGTILNSTKITSYVTYFAQYLKSYYGKRSTINVQNFAHDGDRSTELLTLLQTNETVRAAIKSADIITISIGGNNLMQATNIPGFTTIDQYKAEQGVNDFKKDWRLIIAQIKEIKGDNPPAKIIVNTVYNPFNIDSTPGYENDAAMHILVDSYLSPINDVITNGQNNLPTKYMVANVYAKFNDPYAITNKMGSITYFYPLFSILRNPHPNSTGQNLIKDYNVAAFNSYLK